MKKASLLDRVRARGPAYFPLMREQPMWAVMFAFSRINAARKFERLISSAGYQKPAKVASEAFPTLDLEQVVNALKQDGVYQGLMLPESVVREISEFADSHPCFAKDSPNKGFLPGEYKEINSQRDRDMLTGFYFQTIEACPAAMKLRQDAALRSIATAYLGQEAIIIRTRLWWSFPAERVSDGDLHLSAQNRFHFDIDGWRTLKFFFYLTPTDEGTGAHQYIRASHRRRKLKHQFTPVTGRPTPELEEYYGPEEFVTVTGGAGFGFTEDPFVFHTGTLCRTKPRLMLEIGFGVSSANPAYKNPGFVYGRLG